MYGMFGAQAVYTAEVKGDFHHAVLIGTWPTGNVHHVGTGVVKQELDVMSGVNQSSAYLVNRGKIFIFFTLK